MLRVLFAGSPQAAKITLEKLLECAKECDYQIVGVLSNPPSAKGRHKELTPTPVAEFAMQNNIPVFTPEHLDSACREEISQINPDVLVCFAYGHIFGPKFISLFKFGGINLHPSFLPKYRGCTPVPAAILNRDSQTAITVQTISQKMDEGELLTQEIVELNGTETGESLLNYCADAGADLISIVLDQIAMEQKVPAGMPQVGTPSYTKIITKEDGKINWDDSALKIEAMVRAYFPSPSAWCLENDLPLKINSSCVYNGTYECDDKPNGTVLDFIKAEGILIKTGDGILCVKELQRQGKKSMFYKDFMNGARDFVGTVLK